MHRVYAFNQSYTSLTRPSLHLPYCLPHSSPPLTLTHYLRPRKTYVCVSSSFSSFPYLFSPLPPGVQTHPSTLVTGTTLMIIRVGLHLTTPSLYSSLSSIFSAWVGLHFSFLFFSTPPHSFVVTSTNYTPHQARPVFS